MNHTRVVAYLALFVALGGSSYAAITVTGKTVKDRSLTGKDIKPNSVPLNRLRGSLPRGSAGQQGPQGAEGPQGPPGSDAQFNGAPAGGGLSGSFPNPEIAPGAVGTAKLADGAVTTSKTGTTPAVRAVRTTDFTVSNDLITVVPFTSEDHDTTQGFLFSGMHSNSTNSGRFTAPADGVYYAAATVQWAADAQGGRTLQIVRREEGSSEYPAIAVEEDGPTTQPQSVSGTYALNAGEWLEVRVQHDAGNPLDVLENGTFGGNEFSPSFEMFWVGPS